MGLNNRPFHLAAHGLRARMMPWGAVLMDLRLEGHPDPLVLGFENPADYPAHSPYFGATAGRFANRIGQGQFEIDGQRHQTDRNFLGKHTLHGGAQGVGKRLWTLLFAARDSALFRLRLRDGEMGFPGAMTLTARFSLEADATLRIRYTATTTAPTLCSLAHHSYWCLDGTPDLTHHRLQVDADRVTEVDAELIPTGTLPDVSGTRFDFRRARPVLDPAMIDHNLCLSEARMPLRRVGRLWSEASGVAMEIATTEPGLQVYDGAKVNPSVPGLDGRRYGAHAGVALEPQIWPDAPNHPGFPSALLRPGEVYEQITEFRFSKE